ncbi:MAG: helix-turn-helix transcriptional regulator [Actinobacteria bacterium]|nr:helix-turn-helix transcriptional regulator [Actinomycetota bacterium]
MSGPYLSQLRTGSRGNPSVRTLRQLADVFGVSVEYFTEGGGSYTSYLEAELCWLDLAHDPDVRRITTALLALPPDAREDILRSAMSAPTVAE